MELPRFVRVQLIDHNGFCGRDPHPLDRQIGLVVAVRSILVFHDWDADIGDCSYVVLQCEDPTDGRIYEFMDFEVEPAETPNEAKRPHTYDPMDEVDQ
jgi:hypothetical protein